jgi:hypothetical protein
VLAFDFAVSARAMVGRARSCASASSSPTGRAIAFAATVSGVDGVRIAIWGSRSRAATSCASRLGRSDLAAAIAHAPLADGHAAVPNAMRHMTPLAAVRLTGRGLIDVVAGRLPGGHYPGVPSGPEQAVEIQLSFLRRHCSAARGQAQHRAGVVRGRGKPSMIATDKRAVRRRGIAAEEDLPARPPGGGDGAVPLGLGCRALVLGEAALRLRGTVGAAAIQERGMALEGLCAAVSAPAKPLRAKHRRPHAARRSHGQFRPSDGRSRSSRQERCVMRDRHLPRLCHSCQAPMARQTDACWQCGVPWLTADGSRTTLHVIRAATATDAVGTGRAMAEARIAMDR